MNNSTPPPTTLVEVAAGFSFDDEPIDCVAVSLVHGKRRYDVVLRRDSTRAVAEIEHDPRERFSLTYQYVVHFMQTQTGRVEPLSSPARTTDGRVVIVPARELYQRMRVQMIAASRFSEVRQIAVEVRPRACPANVVTAQFADERREWAGTWLIDRDAALDYDYRMTVEPTSGEIRRGPWLHSDKAVLLVPEYPGESRNVEARLVGKDPLAAGIAAAKIRFSYEDPDSGLRPQQAELEISNVKPVRWTYWFGDGRPEAFTYQLTLVRADGTTTALESVTSTDLVVLLPIT